MTTRKECFSVAGISKPFRILHISDVHFSSSTSHEKNQILITEILKTVDFCTQPDLNLIAVTGDLVSRTLGETSISDALDLLHKLRRIAPVAYSLGNHELDLSENLISEFLRKCRNLGVFVLNNSSVFIQDIMYWFDSAS
ncbi:MAG: metallophosphoesterase [Oscillospiraceae bacterium]|nr:metallophosphoesterase [Oscillospiraceae bacterium]